MKFYYKTYGTITFNTKQHNKLSRFLLDSFLTCNVLELTCSIAMEDFSLNFKVFILITVYFVFHLKNNIFVLMVQKFCIKGSYWLKSCERFSVLVHFILFIICVIFLLVKTLLSMVLKSVSFIVSLLCTLFKCWMIKEWLSLFFF